MDDLLENFSKHINKLISNKLGSKIRNFARATTNYRTDEDYSRTESNIQMLIESYLSTLKDHEYKEIANNIFNSFIEEDDKNLIEAVNFFKRTYEHYQELNLRKKFFKWRKTSLKLKMINNLVLKEKKAQKEKNLNANQQIKINNKNKINEQRYNDEEEIVGDNMNEYFDNNEMNDNYNIDLDSDIYKQEEEEDYQYNNINRNIFDNKKKENVEDFIEKGKNNIQSYKFNYGNIINNKNEDYNQEL